VFRMLGQFDNIPRVKFAVAVGRTWFSGKEGRVCTSSGCIGRDAELVNLCALLSSRNLVGMVENGHGFKNG